VQKTTQELLEAGGSYLTASARIARAYRPTGGLGPQRGKRVSGSEPLVGLVVVGVQGVHPSNE